MESYLFDTSFLISLLDIDDVNHSKALKIISGLEIWKIRFFINDVILNETLTVLNYKKWFEFLEKFESFLEEIKVIYLSWNNEEYTSFFKLILWKVSVADASVIYDWFKHNLVILSFDKEMLKLEEIYSN